MKPDSNIISEFEACTSDELDNTWSDRAALVTKIASSLVPMVGGPLAERITEVIPRLRQERIVEYFRELAARIETLERENVKRILADVEKIDLIESGGYLAARVTASDRISKIAEIVFRGLGAEETTLIRRKRLLGLFGAIDDDELLLLNAYGQSYGRSRSNAWDAIDRPMAYIGSSTEEIDNEKLYELGEQNLLGLGLLQRQFDHVKEGEY